MSPNLEVIKARADAATKGPWEADCWEIYGPTRAVWIAESCRADELVQSADDAKFIAHAREDVPALVAEVERLRAEVLALRGELAAEIGAQLP